MGRGQADTAADEEDVLALHEVGGEAVTYIPRKQCCLCEREVRPDGFTSLLHTPETIPHTN